LEEVAIVAEEDKTTALTEVVVVEVEGAGVETNPTTSSKARGT